MLGRAASLTFPERVQRSASPTVLSVQVLSRGHSTMCLHGEGWRDRRTHRAGRQWPLRGSAVDFGADRLDSGTIELNGTLVDIRSPRDGIARGIDAAREQEGPGAPYAAAWGTHAAPSVGSQPRRRHHRRQQERVSVGGLLQRLAVKPPKVTIIVSRLSGGNQQKVLLEVALRTAASAAARRTDSRRRRRCQARPLRADRLAGGEWNGVLLISSEIEEILGLAHRVLVMRRGLIVAEFAEDELDEEQILRAAFGSEQAAALQVAKGAA